MTKPSSCHIRSSNQSMPRSISQLIMTVRPSPSRASCSSISIDTPSILLITVRAGRYFRVPTRSAIQSEHPKARHTEQNINELVGGNLPWSVWTPLLKPKYKHLLAPSRHNCELQGIRLQCLSAKLSRRAYSCMSAECFG